MNRLCSSRPPPQSSVLVKICLSFLHLKLYLASTAVLNFNADIKGPLSSCFLETLLTTFAHDLQPHDDKAL